MDRHNPAEVMRITAPFARQPHEVTGWALTAWHLHDDTLKIRRGHSSKLVMGMTEAYVRITVGELAREIEISLKSRLRSALVKLHGAQWWSTLPSRVRSNVKARHQWAVNQIGRQRAGRPERIE